jgi:hypothetical protein
VRTGLRGLPDIALLAPGKCLRWKHIAIGSLAIELPLEAAAPADFSFAVIDRRERGVSPRGMKEGAR